MNLWTELTCSRNFFFHINNSEAALNSITAVLIAAGDLYHFSELFSLKFPFTTKVHYYQIIYHFFSFHPKNCEFYTKVEQSYEIINLKRNFDEVFIS